MHIEAHAGAGWLLGNLACGTSRARAWVLAAAMLPDVDAISYLWGAKAYVTYHHTFGHNVFFGALIITCAAWSCRSWRVGGVAAISFAIHLLTDAYLTRYDVFLFWPVSDQGFSIPGGCDLVSPLNTFLAYAGYATFAAVGLVCKRTPLESFSPGLDRLLISFFQRRDLNCATCGRKGNQRCARCGEPVCAKHGQLGKKFEVICPKCAGK